MLKIKANFSSMYGNILTCSTCKEVNTVETEFYLLNCSFLLKETSLENEMKQVKFCDVFCDLPKQTKDVELFRKIMNIYEKQKTLKEKNNPRSNDSSCLI